MARYVPQLSQAQSDTPKRLVLCFDGTSNKFNANEEDTNIVRIYEMLDRNTPDQYHYYQRKPPVHSHARLVASATTIKILLLL